MEAGGDGGSWLLLLSGMASCYNTVCRLEGREEGDQPELGCMFQSGVDLERCVGSAAGWGRTASMEQ